MNALPEFGFEEKEEIYPDSFEEDGVFYGNKNYWGLILAMEPRAVANAMGKAGITTRLRKALTANKRKTAYYSREEIQNVFARRLEAVGKFPRSERDGILSHEGKRYATLDHWTDALGMVRVNIRRKIQEAGLQGITAFNAGNVLCEEGFFEETEIDALVGGRLSTEYLKANEEGILMVQKEKFYPTVLLLREIRARGIHMPNERFYELINRKDIRKKEGLNAHNQKKPYYSLNDVLKCLNALPPLPKVNTRGNIVVQGKVFLSHSAALRLFEKNTRARPTKELQRAMGEGQIKVIYGINAKGETLPFYSAWDIQSHLNMPMPEISRDWSVVPEAELLRICREESGERASAAQGEMLKRKKRLIRGQVWRFHQPGSADFDDATSEANLGVMRATQIFDPSRKSRFDNTARAWIKAKTTRWSESNRAIRIPQHWFEERRTTHASRDYLRVKRGREVGLAEVATFMEVDPEKLDAGLRNTSLSGMVSLDSPIPGSEGKVPQLLHETIGINDSDVESRRSEFLRRVREAYESPSKEQDLEWWWEYFFEGKQGSELKGVSTRASQQGALDGVHRVTKWLRSNPELTDLLRA